MSVASKMKLDIGCGKKKQDGYIGIDVLELEGVDLIGDLRVAPWRLKRASDGTSMVLKDGSVSEVYSNHFLEHLTGLERVSFFNELYRVMEVGAEARIITPHWSHERAYGDPTHQWPPITSMMYFYLIKEWRDLNASYVGYNCDFGVVMTGYHDQNDTWISYRNQETKSVLMTRNINTTTDLVAVLTKK